MASEQPAITGVSQVIKNLSKYSKAVVYEVVASCEAVQAKVITTAQSRVPVVTRNLQGSIQPGGILIEDDNVSAFVNANAPYASYVEGVPDSQGRYGRGKKTPFLGPALMENQRRFAKSMADAIKRAERAL